MPRPAFLSLGKLMLRVMTVHAAYQHRGGEDSVVESEEELLVSRGHEVQRFARNNADINGMGRITLVGRTFWSREVAADFSARLAEFKPDVVHVHNTFPLISPSVYWVAAAKRVPLVQTLHNFRLMCPQAMFLRNGKVCEDCKGTLPWRGALRGCYRDSIVQSTVLASMISGHRLAGTWKSKVTRYIALNEFCRERFIEGGFPAAKIVVKPNFVSDDSVQDLDRSDFLYVGRLSPEKGISVLADACKQKDFIRVGVVGGGPEFSTVESMKGAIPLGILPREGVIQCMRSAIALIVPSVWFETFGLVVLEAFAAGTPVIASRIGVLPDLVEDGVTGLLFEPGNSVDLASKLEWAYSHPQEMRRMGLRARRVYEEKYTADKNHKMLIDIYGEAIAEAGKGAVR